MECPCAHVRVCAHAQSSHPAGHQRSSSMKAGVCAFVLCAGTSLQMCVCTPVFARAVRSSHSIMSGFLLRELVCLCDFVWVNTRAQSGSGSRGSSASQPHHHSPSHCPCCFHAPSATYQCLSCILFCTCHPCAGIFSTSCLAHVTHALDCFACATRALDF